MTTFNRNTDRYADLDALLDFAYSADARRAAERERNRAVGQLLDAPEGRRGRRTLPSRRAS